MTLNDVIVQVGAISCSEFTMAALSSYADGLSEQAKSRYEEKIQLVGSLDPFLLPTTRSLASPAELPPVEASDIVAYLVLQTSFLTTKQFKAHKSLEAYNQFINGWVKDVQAWSAQEKIVVTGRVSICCPSCLNIFFLGVSGSSKNTIIYYFIIGNIFIIGEAFSEMQ